MLEAMALMSMRSVSRLKNVDNPLAGDCAYFSARELKPLALQPMSPPCCQTARSPGLASTSQTSLGPCRHLSESRAPSMA
jgi:hypothetical protein